MFLVSSRPASAYLLTNKTREVEAKQIRVVALSVGDNAIN